MTDLTLKNASMYAALWLLNALVGCLALALATGHVWGFREGELLAPMAASLGTALGLIGSGLAFWLASNRPKLGREDISALVNQVGALNVRALLTDFLHGRAPIAPLSDAELDVMADRIYERIEARMTADRGV